jgi:zinc transporter, ZIP family
MIDVSIFEGMPLWLLGAIFSLLAGLATGVGAVAILFFRGAKFKYQNALLGFGAGVMLAATSFSLIVPGLEYAGGGTYAAAVVVFGMIVGGMFIYFSDKIIPHEFFIRSRKTADILSLKKAWLFIFAIVLHNFPEGLAVGVGFGGNDILNGISLAIGIGLQNIPEGLAVAFALFANGYSRRTSFFIGLLSGAVEPIGGILGAGVVSVFQPILPWALAFAAGAMLFVIVGEIIPESHKEEKPKIVTLSVLLGFLVMLFLDIALG